MTEASYLWASFLQLVLHDTERDVASGQLRLQNPHEFSATITSLIGIAQRPLAPIAAGGGGGGDPSNPQRRAAPAESHFRANNRHHTQMLNAVSTNTSGGDLYEALDHMFRKYLSYELLFGWPHVPPPVVAKNTSSSATRGEALAEVNGTATGNGNGSLLLAASPVTNKSFPSAASREGLGLGDSGRKNSGKVRRSSSDRHERRRQRKASSSDVRRRGTSKDKVPRVGSESSDADNNNNNRSSSSSSSASSASSQEAEEGAMSGRHREGGALAAVTPPARSSRGRSNRPNYDGCGVGQPPSVFSPLHLPSQARGQVQWMLPRPDTPNAPMPLPSALGTPTASAPSSASGAPHPTSGGSHSSRDPSPHMSAGGSPRTHPPPSSATSAAPPAAAVPASHHDQPTPQAASSSSASSPASHRGLLRVELHNCPRMVLQTAGTIFEDAMRVAKHYVSWSDKRHEEEEDEYLRAVAVARRNVAAGVSFGGAAAAEAASSSSPPHHKFYTDSFQQKLASYRPPRRTIRKKFVLIAGGDKFGGDNTMRQWRSQDQNHTNSNNSQHGNAAANNNSTTNTNGKGNSAACSRVGSGAACAAALEEEARHTRKTVLIETHGKARYQVNPVTEWVKRSTFADKARGGEPSVCEEDVWVLQCTDMDADTTIATYSGLVSTYVGQIGKVLAQQQQQQQAAANGSASSTSPLPSSAQPTKRVVARPLDNHFSADPNADTRLVIQVIIAADFSHQTVKTPTALAALRERFVPLMDQLFRQMRERDAELFPSSVCQVMFRVEIVICNAPVAISNPATVGAERSPDYRGGDVGVVANAAGNSGGYDDAAGDEEARRREAALGSCARQCRELFLTVQYPCVSIALDMPATAFFCGIEVPMWGTSGKDVEAVNILFARVHRGIGEGSHDAARIVIHRGMDVCKDDHLASTVADRHTEGVALNNIMFHFWSVAPTPYRMRSEGCVRQLRALPQNQQLLMQQHMQQQQLLQQQQQQQLQSASGGDGVGASSGALGISPGVASASASASEGLRAFALPPAAPQMCGSAPPSESLGLFRNGSFAQSAAGGSPSQRPAPGHGLGVASPTGPLPSSGPPAVASAAPVTLYDPHRDTSIVRGYRIYGSILNGVCPMLRMLRDALRRYTLAPSASSRNPLAPSAAPRRSLSEAVAFRRLDPAQSELMVRVEVAGRRLAAASSAELLWGIVRAAFNTIGIHVMLQTQTTGDAALQLPSSSSPSSRKERETGKAGPPIIGGSPNHVPSASPVGPISTTAAATAGAATVTVYALELSFQPFQHARHAALINAIPYVAPLLANGLFPLWELCINLRVRLFQTLRDANKATAMALAEGGDSHNGSASHPAEPEASAIAPGDGVLFPIPIIGNYDDVGEAEALSLASWLAPSPADAASDAGHPTRLYNRAMGRRAACSVYIPITRLIVVPRAVLDAHGDADGDAADGMLGTARGGGGGGEGRPLDGESVLARCAFSAATRRQLEEVAIEFAAMVTAYAADAADRNKAAQRSAREQRIAAEAAAGGGGHHRSHNGGKSPAAAPRAPPNGSFQALSSPPGTVFVTPPPTSNTSFLGITHTSPNIGAAVGGHHASLLAAPPTSTPFGMTPPVPHSLDPMALQQLASASQHQQLQQQPPNGSPQQQQQQRGGVGGGAVPPPTCTVADVSLPLPLAELLVTKIIEARRGEGDDAGEGAAEAEGGRAPAVEIGLFVDFNDLSHSFNCSFPRGRFCPSYGGYSLSGTSADWGRWLRAVCNAFAAREGGSYQRAEASVLSPTQQEEAGGGHFDPHGMQQQQQLPPRVLSSASFDTNASLAPPPPERQEEARLTGLWASLGVGVDT